MECIRFILFTSGAALHRASKRGASPRHGLEESHRSVFWLPDRPRVTPSRIFTQWLHATFVPGYSGGPATDFHRVPRRRHATRASTESLRIMGHGGSFCNNRPMIELILGGARSGKSALAEQRAVESGLAVTYIATAQAGDAEMVRRIAHHQARRPPHWALVEEPLHLAAALNDHAATDCCLLVDCLTLWLTNLFYAGAAARQAEAGAAVNCPLLAFETSALLYCLPQIPGRVILVSNEVGLGIVPLGAATRVYVDEAGRLNQSIARIAQRVSFVAAGLPLELKHSVA
jgi:adenosylcobinamide kinase/adenosylcobinamide-phosphate guanylyltransferase